ncbi:hypothetical protein AOT83_01665 [Mycobacteroides sp. H001]|uniref:hypothetical protein n=2 Tax=Mycobacteriaceae TaxID=1762 RepID=UPI0007152F0B|nr:MULTISPECIES: hypothetical protein [Mycobacteroides]KRQ48318.1 hypothetical protein AOT85_19300 [Mycobacteroides sp. H054]KRQ20672.1 hypothetical protein AOT86_22910 [Mycobacteroides sp. H072]KRQ42734.1 hypothetical protein AOT84_00615 [Mycobacteroides sp. H002]KRQ73125.1 hypothetical protein AOT83_01665 [Mycobacteroides sp. H001]OHU39162.1 hypothetical protein BKG79_12300 [Mycobacteroides chelonae]
MQIARLAFLFCFLPVLLYRIWRLWRYPASALAVAATCFGIVMWFWLVLLSDDLWAVLPAQLRAAALGGWILTMMAACTQIFVLGISGSASPARLIRGRRIILLATTIVLVVVAVSTRHSQELLQAKDLQTALNAILDGTDRGVVVASVASSGYLAVALVQLIWAGFRHADSTPVGTGLGLLSVASSFQIITVVFGGIWRPLTGGHDMISANYGLVLQSVGGSVGVTLMAVGFLWAPVVLRARARRDERRLRPLHDEFVRLFPQLFPPMESQIRLSDKVFEWTAHIQDGLTLLAQGRQVPAITDVPIPEEISGRAFAVTNWLTDQPVPGFSCEWLRPTEGVSDQAWVLIIADMYREHRKNLSAPGSERERLPVRR